MSVHQLLETFDGQYEDSLNSFEISLDNEAKMQEMNGNLTADYRIKEMELDKIQMIEEINKLKDVVKTKEITEKKLLKRISSLNEAKLNLLRDLNATRKMLCTNEITIYKLENINKALKTIHFDDIAEEDDATATALGSTQSSGDDLEYKPKDSSVQNMIVSKNLEKTLSILIVSRIFQF